MSRVSKDSEYTPWKKSPPKKWKKLFKVMALSLALLIAGAGIIVLLEAAARLYLPEYRNGVEANLVFGSVLIGIGLGGLIGWVWDWPAALVVVAAVILKGSPRSGSGA